MRAIVMICLIAVASAQYDYPGQEEVGAAQLSQPIAPLAEFNKEFYTYSAPESEFNDHLSEDALGAVKKNLRVVFIKSPENTALESAALNLAKAASDDRTAIYVLNKQSDIGALANQLQSLRNTASNKPEVHFVKYRTNSDADNAQRTIQSQYDSLPGPSSNHNAGSAPVLDFGSKAAPVAAPSQSYVPANNGYLPPGRRF